MTEKELIAEIYKIEDDYWNELDEFSKRHEVNFARQSKLIEQLLQLRNDNVQETET